MKTLGEIEEAIARLPRNQMYELAARLDNKLGDAWDRQFERDVVAGRLQSAANAALAEHRSGKSSVFPPDRE